MTRKEIKKMKSYAYISACNGLEIKAIENKNGSEYLCCVSGAWNGKEKAHKLKIRWNPKSGSHVKLNGYTLKIADCVKM